MLHNVESEGVSKLSANAVVFSVISQNYSEIVDAWQPPPPHGHRHSIALVDPGLLADPVRGNPAGF